MFGRTYFNKYLKCCNIRYQFLHQDAKENYDVLENFDDQIMTLEKETLSTSPEKQVIHDIVALKKELIKMSKRLWASSKIIFTIKKELTSIKLTKEENSLLDDIYDTALKAGANGGKISGAGGGGFIMFYCPANSKQKVIKELNRFGGRAYNYVFVDDGLITLTVK